MTKPSTALKSLPSTLTHYTSLAGLMGIVTKGRIWASNVSFLNDHRELQHGLAASLAAIRVLSKSGVAAKWRGPLKDAEAKLRNGNIPNTYAACFCTRTDSLSQWRGYGGGEQGISLTFTRAALTKLLAKDNARLHRVVYCDLTTEKRMKKAVEDQLGSLDEFDELLGESSPEGRNREAYDAICGLLPKFKHLSFSDERELRFVVQQPDMTDKVCFRPVGNVIVPYLALGPGPGVKLPIKTVRVGPGRNPELTVQSLKLFLSQHGYGEVPVVPSKVPFRS